MTSIEKETQKYISDVSSKLLCSSKKKKKIIEDIRSAVLDFIENSGTKDISDVCKHFGTPEELAKAYMSDLDPKQIKKKVNIRKVVIIAAIVALLLYTIVITMAFIDSKNAAGGDTIYYSAQEITQIKDNI